MGYACEGFDPCERYAQIAREQSDRAVHVADFESLDLAHRFHGVLCLASLHHVPRSRLVGALRNLRKHLWPCGVLYILVPSAAEEKDGYARDDTAVDGVGCWVNNMPFEAFKDTVKAAGFEVSSARTGMELYGWTGDVLVATRMEDSM